jgi:Uma2 family endonuclease
MDHPTDLTWDEFLDLPYETRNASLIDGEVVVNSPIAQHELVVRNLNLLFMHWLQGGPDRGEVCTQQPIKITDHRGYQPDFAWYSADACSDLDEPLVLDGLPQLVVEVLSPSTRRFDMVRKRADYERIGIGEVWFVELDERKVLLCQRTQDADGFVDVERTLDDLLTSPLLPAFAVPVKALFARRPEVRW